MKENFDCTQFITFDLKEHKQIMNLLIHDFNQIEFDIIFDIRNIKKIYFKQYLRKYFIELKDDDFMGEFEDWKLINKPPKRIRDFINVVKKIAQIKNIKNFTIILTYFAELGNSTNKMVNVNISNLERGLYIMSRYNFDYYVDNLILKID